MPIVVVGSISGLIGRSFLLSIRIEIKYLFVAVLETVQVFIFPVNCLS